MSKKLTKNTRGDEAASEGQKFVREAIEELLLDKTSRKLMIIFK